MPSRPVLVESESRKIGQLHLPESLMLRMRASPCVSLECRWMSASACCATSTRTSKRTAKGCTQRLERLVPLYQDKRVAAWRALADAGQLGRTGGRLLLEHYDPAYQRSMGATTGQVGRGPVIAMPSATEDWRCQRRRRRYCGKLPLDREA